MLQHKGTQSIETQRLILRQFSVQDAQPMYENWASDPEVTRFLTWPVHTSPEISATVIQNWMDGYSSQSFYQWAITRKDQVDAPIGSISVVYLDEEKGEAEIGYCIGRAWWHMGIMSEALKAVMDYLFTQVGVNKIVANHDARNPHSGGVMRKCGMQYVGTFPQSGQNNQGICDLCRYSLCREDGLCY